MNSYAKVRAPDSNKSKSISDQAEPKQAQISLSVKQPFKMSQPGIEQPKIRVNHAPSVVHIIERKANKMEQSKISSAQSERKHVIQPSAKKAWRFNLNQDLQDQYPPQNAKEEKSSQKVLAPLPQHKIQAPIVNLPQKQESLSDPKGRMTYQRRLERAISQSVSQNSKKSSQSALQEGSVHHLDFGQPIKAQSIHLQEVVEMYRNADKKFLQRNLAVSEQWMPPNLAFGLPIMMENIHLQQVVEIYRNSDKQFLQRSLALSEQWIPQKEQKIKSSVVFDDKNRIQVYQINEQLNRPSDRIKLKRNIEGIHEQESSMYYNEPQQIFLEQMRESRSSQRKSMMVVQDSEGKVKDIFIPDDYEENRNPDKVANQIRRLWIVEDKDKIHEITSQKQGIFIDQDYQQGNSKAELFNHKRLINHSRVSNQEKQIKIQSSLPQRPLSQSVHLKSIQEQLQDNRPSLKQMRKLVIVEDDKGNQQTFIPEQFQQIMPKQPLAQSIHLSSVEEGFYDDKRSSKLQRKLLILEDRDGKQEIFIPQQAEDLADSKGPSKNMRNLLIKEGRVGEQQIFINEQYQDNPQRMSALNQRRSLVNSERSSQKQEKMASRPIPVLPNSQKIDLSQVFQQIDPKQVGSKHSRKLLVLQEKNGKIASQQINIPSQELIAQQININHELEHSLKSKALMSHKRTVMKSSQKAQNAPKMQQIHSVQIDSIKEMWDSNSKNSKLSRKLLILQNQKGQILAQQITIPQQLQQNNNRSDVSSHKRELRLMKLPQEHKPEANHLSHLDIKAQDYEYSPHNSSKLKMSRNLLLIKEESGKEIYQQVIIPQDFQVKQAKISNIHYKRQIVNDYQPKVDKQHKINTNLPQANEMQYEQVIIPSDLQQKSSQRFVQSHRRTVKHLQALPQDKRQSQNIIEEPVVHEPLQIQQIIEDYSYKSKKSKQARSLLVIQQPNGKLLAQEIIIPQDFSQSKHQKQPKLEHKRQFKIITFEEEPNINKQIPIPNKEIVPTNNIVINSVEENYKPSQKSQKTSRSLLAIQNSNGETLYQEVFLPDMEESNLGQSLVDSHKRQFQIVTVEDPDPQQELQKPIKIGSHPLPEAQQIDVEQIHESSHKNENPKYKRALLLAQNEEGKVVSQQIKIPDQHQMEYNQRPSITHQRNIRSLNKTGHGLPLNSPQASQDVHPQKSFNPSTLNSSQAQNLNFNTSLEQSRASPDYRPLTRSLAPCPEKLSQSQHSNDPHERFFDVYNPRAFLDGKLLSSQMSLPTPIHNVDRPLKPHRRPGFF